MPTLYSALDEGLDHFRRYDDFSLGELLRNTGFQVVSIRYMNALGALGWWFNGKILKRRILPERQLGIMDALLPYIVFRVSAEARIRAFRFWPSPAKPEV